MHKLLAMC